MFNAASKLAFTAGAVAAIAGFATVLATSDRVAFTALVFAGAIAVVLGLAVFWFAPRDPVVPASAEVEAASARAVDVTDLPAASPWPLVAALSITLLAVGAALGKGLVVIGLIVAVVAAFAWLGQAWTEHPSWTQAMTDRINDRFVVPIGLPGTAILFAGLGAVSLSRIFLAVSAEAAPVIGAVLAFAILGAFYLLSKTENVGRNAVRALVAVSTALVIGAGVTGAVAGERDFHHAGATDEEEHGESADGESTDAKFQLKAEEISFDTEELQLPSLAAITLAFENADDESIQHNFSIYREDDGEAVFRGEVVEGGHTVDYEFTTPEAGLYRFQCDVHPDEMNGTVEVTEDASQGDATDERGVNATTSSTTEP